MSQIIDMPKLGLTMTHGKITRWLKNEGDPVKAGELIVEIETDKINSEVESPADGYLLKILAAEGEEREITKPICIIGEKGEIVDSPKVGDDDIGGPSEKAEEQRIQISPEAKKPAEENVKISPIAKKIAEEHGVDYKRINGTGPEGRIVKEDILAVIEAGKSSQAVEEKVQEKTLVEETKTVSQAEVVAEGTAARKVPLAGIRRVIARRLSQSKHDIPHTYFKISVDASNIIELKNRFAEKVRLKTGKKLTLNDIIVKGIAEALVQFPDINVSLIEDEIIYHGNINIGIAVDSPRGLMVPVIKDADKKGLSEISRISGDLIDKVKNGKTVQDDITGSTFTISNLGAYHIDEFSAIINPPESAILAVGRAAETPCAQNGEVVVKPIMNLTLSVDHRVIDGALAARFMKKIKNLLEDPYSFLI